MVRKIIIQKAIIFDSIFFFGTKLNLTDSVEVGVFKCCVVVVVGCDVVVDDDVVGCDVVVVVL